MTTGSWSVGTINANGFLAYKAWSGVDGKFPAYPGSRRPRWNQYKMSSHQAMLAARGQPTGDWDRVTVRAYPGLTDSIQSDSTNSTRVSFSNFSIPQGDVQWTMRWTTALELALQAKLLDKVKNHSYNMGVSLAEVEKLSGTVLTSIKTLTYGLLDLYHGRFTAFARRFGTSPPSRAHQKKLYAKDISGRWLEMQYAVLPTIHDAYEAAKAFEALSDGPRRVTFQVSKRIAYQTLVDSAWTVGVIKGHARRKYTYEAYEELSFARQMGLGNPASIVWERIPWSFVVDWFIPIGTYLELLGQIPFLKGRFCRSDSLEEYWAGYTEMKKIPFGSGYRQCIKPLNWSKSHWFWCSRTPLSSLSVPIPHVEVHGAVHGRRILNAIALSHQLFIKARSRSDGDQSATLPLGPAGDD